MVIVISIVVVAVVTIAFWCAAILRELARVRADHARLLCAIDEASRIVGGPTQSALREILVEYRRGR